MAIYLKKFSTHQEYEVFTATTAFIKPNVSICTTEGDVHYNPLTCEETTTYELVGTPSYPSEVDGASTSFDMTFNYKRTDINDKCSETVTEGSDTVTVEIGANPSTASSRTVDSTYDYHGLEIPYSVTQTKFEAKVIAKFNVTDTSNPTKITNVTTGFSKIEIDGVKVMITTGYTFDEVGEHTVKYTLTSPTSIGNDAFNQCSGLTSVDIPDTVTTIGNSTFTSCSSLTSIVIPSGVTSIYQYAFQNCTSLTSINFPSGVTIIDNQAFFQCSSLTSIDIPDSVTSIGNSTFAGCTGLTSITVDNNNANYSSEDGVLFNKAKTTLIQYPIGNSLTSYSIPNSVTSIGTFAFYGCSSLTSCTIGSGVTSIGQSAFRSCTSLTSIVSNVTTAPTIQNFTFYQVKTGGTLTVPSGSSGYNVWMGTGNYYLGKYNWTKVEQ